MENIQTSKFVVNGTEILIPWKPACWVSSADKAGNIISTPQEPSFLKALRRLESGYHSKEVDSQKLFHLGLAVKATASREIISNLQTGIELQAYQGNIVLTSSLPAMAFVQTEEFIYVSSHYVNNNKAKWDFDGDLLKLGVNPNAQFLELNINGQPAFWQQCVPVKNPITRAIQPGLVGNSSVLSLLKPEALADFTTPRMEDWFTANQELRSKEDISAKAMFEKSHTILNVGEADGLAKVHALMTTEGLPRKERIKRLYGTDVPFVLLEQNALGLVRKDHDIMDLHSRALLQEAQQYSNFSLPAPYRCLITNTNSTPSHPHWVFAMDLAKHTERAALLDIPTWIERGEGNFEPEEVKTFTDKHRVIETLTKLGIIQYKEIPNDFHPELPPAVQIMLVRGKKVVALTDIRKAQGVLPGLTWSFVLPPVWDAQRQEWVHPMTHLHRCAQPIWTKKGDDEPELIQGFDGAIRTRHLGPKVREWGKRVSGSPWSADIWGRDINLSIFQRWLANHVGKYGFVTPTGENHQLQPFNEKIVRNTVVVDYGRDSYDIEAWWDAVQPIADKVCLVSKGNDHRVRKYALTDGVRPGPWYASTGANHRRAGQMLSQLSRVIVPDIKMRVAIVCPTPLDQDPSTWAETNQVQITQSGIKKQLIPNGNSAFYNRVSYVPDEHCPDQVMFTTIHGQNRFAWLGNPKTSKKVGKLIDGNGNKFCSCPTIGFNQAWTEAEGLVNPKVGDKISNGGYGDIIVESIEDGYVYGHDKTDRRVRAHIQDCQIKGKIRTNIDLLFPVKELVDKGLLELFMEDATQELMFTDDGREIIVWVVDMVFHRGGGPTENMLVKNKRSFIAGFDAQLVQAGSTRFPIKEEGIINPLTNTPAPAFHDYWAITVPGLQYAQEVKQAVSQFMEAVGLGRGVMIPLDSEQTYESFTSHAESSILELDLGEVQYA